MASPFKRIADIQSLADYTKFAKQVIGKLGEEPVKVHYFAKFKFDKKDAPLLLIGDIPTPLLMEVKKLAGPPLIGHCSLNMAKQLVFEGAVKPGIALKALQSAGIQQQVASARDDGEEDPPPVAKAAAAKTLPVTVVKSAAPVSKPVPKLPVAPPTASSAAPVVKATTPERKAPVPSASAPPKQTPASKPPPTPPKTPSPKPPAPTSGPTAPNPAAVNAQRLKAVTPLWQKALDLPDAPQEELQRRYKAAHDAAAGPDPAAATAALDALDALVSETLAKIKTPAAEVEPEITGQFAKSRKEWQKAMRQAGASISALQAAILKTKDPRATGLASGFKRILKKIPNPAPSLEALALAAEKKDADAAAKHKTEAMRLTNLCKNYLGTDRLVTLAMDNPFVPVKLNDHFQSALKTLHAELK